MPRPEYRRRRRLMGEINVVPYIDVMLVLLVIFMVTAPLLTQGVKVDMVQAVAKPMETKDQDPFVVTVDRDGKYFINEQRAPTELGQLGAKAAAVKNLRSDTEFMVRGDRAVAYEHVVRAMAALKEAGIASVGLVTEPPEQN